MPATLLKWPGFSACHTLIIGVDKSSFNIQSGLYEHAGKLFKPKPETHVTVFGSTTGSALQRMIVQKPETEGQLRTAFESTDWSYTISEDVRRLARDVTNSTATATHQQSIIVLLEMQGMAQFYLKLKSLGLLGHDTALPPAHVTLYTHNCDKGIGVHSDSELAELSCERLQLPG